MNRHDLIKNRKYPYAKVGDTFGPYTITKLLARDGTSNERVE